MSNATSPRLILVDEDDVYVGIGNPDLDPLSERERVVYSDPQGWLVNPERQEDYGQFVELLSEGHYTEEDEEAEDSDEAEEGE